MSTRTTRGTSWALAALLLGSTVGCHSTGKYRLPPAWGDRDCEACEVDSCDCARSPGPRGAATTPSSPPQDAHAGGEPRKRQPLFGKKSRPSDTTEFDETATSRMKEDRRVEVEVEAHEETAAPAKRKTALRERATEAPAPPPRGREAKAPVDDGRPAQNETRNRESPNVTGGEPRRKPSTTNPSDRAGRARLADVAGDAADDTRSPDQDDPFAAPADRDEKPVERPARSNGEKSAEAAEDDETAWWDGPGKTGPVASRREHQRPGRATSPDEAVASTRQSSQRRSATRGAEGRPTPADSASEEVPPTAPDRGGDEAEVEDYYYQPSQAFARDDSRFGQAEEPEPYPYSRANNPLPQTTGTQPTSVPPTSAQPTSLPEYRASESQATAPAPRPAHESTAPDPNGLQPTQYLESKHPGNTARPRIDGIFDLPMIQPGASYRNTSTPPLRSRW